jgi:hypothetical protein
LGYKAICWNWRKAGASIKDEDKSSKRGILRLSPGCMVHDVHTLLREVKMHAKKSWRLFIISEFM